ncbi:hypothetical protein MMC28_000167 [Mycoblastus sanguinarius]|nr:hypothetical protein [Mycoblastus sanguinarius]
MAPHSPPSGRRPLPQPVEETTRTNRASPTKGRSADMGGTKPRRALPQPVSTSTKHSKKPSKDAMSHDHGPNSLPSSKHPLPQPMESSPQGQKPRRFTPQIIETTRRSRKNIDTSTGVISAHKTELAPGNQDHIPPHMRSNRPSATSTPTESSLVVSTDPASQVPESKFSSSKIAERAERRHSFRVPDLPAITSQPETEESNDSSVPSLSTSPSATSDETESNRKKKESRARRESQDDRFSGYLLKLAAKAAEKQLREQAMAAYPNENMHEPVDHYAIDRDSEESDVEAGVGKLSVDGPGEERADRKLAEHRHRHRDSAAGWDMAEMRKHQSKLEQQKQDQWAAEKLDFGRRRSIKKSVNEGDVQNVTGVAGAPPKDIIGWQKDNEMKPMRNAASPPMAGEDLVFPKCLSPRTTRVDITSYPGMKKRPGVKNSEHTGLWSPRDDPNKKPSGSGLWMGVNAKSAQHALAPPKQTQTGLLTPAVERMDPFSSDFDSQQLPTSPPNSQEESKIDAILQREKSIEIELNDNFVTQVYNYLSLGYPSLARKFDPELSKITKVPVEDLQKDDQAVNAKGYVGAPEGTGMDLRGVKEGECARWLALKAYVREWGRQQPDMGQRDEAANGEWGARARKGSWAI